MRIEINLLPGAKRGKKQPFGGVAVDFKAMGAAIVARFTDVWLGLAVLSGAGAAVVIGMMFVAMGAKEASMNAATERAVADSTNFAAVLHDRALAEANRDNVLRQLNIIRAIDEDRFIWPHILDEVSRTLPAYMWLRTIAITGTPQGTNPAAAFRLPPDTAKKKRPFVLPRDTVRVKIEGRFADMQAFTAFYSALEDSPFLGNVQLNKTETMVEMGKEIHSFAFDVMFTRPDSSLLRRVPLTIPPRQ